MGSIMRVRLRPVVPDSALKMWITDGRRDCLCFETHAADRTFSHGDDADDGVVRAVYVAAVPTTVQTGWRPGVLADFETLPEEGNKLCFICLCQSD